MNELGVVLVGCIVRCTLLAGAGLALGAILRRRGPAEASLVSLTTLVVLIAVPVFAVSPWPRWWTFQPVLSPGTFEPKSAKDEPLAARPVEVTLAGQRTELPPSLKPPARESWFVAFAGEFEREVRRPLVVQNSARWGWPAWVAIGILAGLSLGLFRLLVGLRGVSVLRGRSVPVEDTAMLDALDLCRAEMNCVQPVGLLESSEVATPATVGWRRPAIILPANWQDWDEQERRVVLAHELAHINRSDYFFGVFAQVSVALHFYHPLAHWLAARLRLQQELAADAWGARLAGGTRPYVTTLAQLALRQADKPMTWPARPFLPTRGTFLRRLEMLRDVKQIPHAPSNRKSRLLTIGLLVAAGLVVAGLRGPDGSQMAFAQTAAAPPPGERSHSLAFIPSDTGFIISGRPADLLTLPEFAPITKVVQEMLKLPGHAPLPIERFGQVTAFWLSGRVAGEGLRRSPGGDRPSGLILRALTNYDWKKLFRDLVPESEEIPYLNGSYLRPKLEGQYNVYVFDDRTAVLADEILLKDLIKQGPNSTVRHSWDRAWKEIDRGQLVVAGDGAWLREQLLPLLTPERPPSAIMSIFSPIWEKTRTFAVGVSATGGMKLDAVATCDASDDAKQVGETLQSILTLARNALQGLHKQARLAPPGQRVPMNAMLAWADLVDPILEKAEVKVQESEGQNLVRIRAVTSLKVADIVKSLFPSVTAALAVARHAESINNLKQIGLAFHNYHQANNHFPASAGVAPNSKFPHSWRVAILPYVEQTDLYNRYRFDEPWDSANNRKLIDKMPAVYRRPSAAPNSTSSSYYVFTGPTTLFPDEKGVGIAEITDGTSNTILAVEAKRDIPWTKPEDIPFDPSKPLPELGGSQPQKFDALFADGSVKVLGQVPPHSLRSLISKAGGEVIDHSRLNP